MELRQYLTVIWKWLWLIVLGTFLAGSTAGAVSFAKPRVYEAKAGVAIVKSGYSFDFEPKIKTLSEELASQQSTNLDARRVALVAMVENGAIAAKVIEALGSELSPEEQNAGVLLGMVTGEAGGTAREQGDLIGITVKADNPKKAMLIANAWGRAYEEYVNEIYGGGVPGSRDTIEGQSVSAKAAYENAQAALTLFIADNQIDELNRQIQEKQEIIASLQSGKQTAVTTVIDTELEARSKIIAEYINTQANNRLTAFSKEQQGKSAILAAYMDAELNNRLTAIQKDQEARSKLFAQYVEAEINNRLLPFQKDQEARSKLFAQYVETEISNRLLPFQKDQEARSKLFAQYVETEINNRLAAFQKEQEAKSALFNAYVNADTTAQTTVFNKQVEAKVQTLANSYAAKLKLEQLLKDAQALREQIDQGRATGSSATSGLAILLLKAEAFASSAGLPGDLQLQLDTTTGLATSPDEQVRDLGALISVLEDRVEELDGAIEVQSQELFNNERYQFLDTSRPKDDPLTKAIHQKYEELFGVGELAKAADTVPVESELSQAIMAKYNELFGVGELARAADTVPAESELSQAIMAKYEELFGVGELAKAADTVPAESDLSQAIMAKYEELFGVGELAKAADTAPLSSDLSEAIMAKYEELFGVGDLAKAAQSTPFTTSMFASIKAKYPDLFEIGDLAELTEGISADNPLAVAATEKSQELLQLKDLEDLPAYTAAEPLTRAIDKLEKEIDQLQAQLEQEDAIKQELTRARDLAWETYSTLARKVEEVSVASTVTGTEVKFAIPAVEPRFPVSRKTMQNTVLAGMVGLMLAAGVAFLMEYMSVEPSMVSEALRRSVPHS